ncbi:MAG: hypothetical protein HYV07_23935 [Deltaproteobacteria bacterium]|nr:hypothetical protein [Deltaproteobacteria bacterium]
MLGVGSSELVRRHGTRPRAGLAALGTFVLALLGAGQLALIGHELTVAHNTCIEHNETVHGFGSFEALGLPSPDPGVDADAPEASVDLHAHCGLRSMLGSPIVEPSVPDEIVAAPTTFDRGQSGVPVAAAEPIERILLAPKASPPRA